MRPARARSLLLCGLAGLLLAGRAAAVEPVAPDQFDRLAALVRPDPGEEKWAEVNWQTSLWEARQKAAKEGKPILLWEMDGHPLGCT